MIIPLVICHAPGGWTSPRHFHELFGRGLGELPELVQFVPAFTMIVDDLAHLGDDELKARTLAVFPKLALWLLRDARSADRFNASLPIWAASLAEAKQATNGMMALQVLLRYLTLVNNDLSWEHLQATVHELAPSVEQDVMTIAEQLIDKGRAEGLDKGLVKGRADLLTKLLALKFGELSDPVHARLAAASADELDAWAQRVLTATTLEQVFADA